MARRRSFGCSRMTALPQVLPNIYDAIQLREFVDASDKPRLSREELERLTRLVSVNFGIEPEEPKFKGTMELPEELLTT